MDMLIARNLRNRLAPLSAIAVTFATITSVPVAMTVVAAAGRTAAHQTKAAWMDQVSLVAHDREATKGGNHLATVYTNHPLILAARAPQSEIR
jgi:hypothetical protein